MNNILVIDENRSILDVLSVGLGRRLKDHVILTARDGEEGTSILRAEPIGLILTALDAPGKEALAFIEHALKNYPEIPICVMTGNCPPSMFERLSALGVRRYIEKPFQLDALAQMINGELKEGQRMIPADGPGHA